MIDRQQISVRLKFLSRLLFSPSQRKYVLTWLASFKKNYLIQNKVPWLPFDAISYLSTLNLEGKKIFEYGSGGSTLFWLKKGAYCVSIEHDPMWFTRVNESLNPESKLDFRLVKPLLVSDLSGNPADPDSFTSNSPDFKQFSFENYVEQIEEFPSDYFDLIMIDGRSRPACIKHSINKLKLGGWLVLDDADRDYYFKFTQDLLTNFSLKKFFGAGPCMDFWMSTNVYIRQWH